MEQMVIDGAGTQVPVFLGLQPMGKESGQAKMWKTAWKVPGHSPPVSHGASLLGNSCIS
jgi:hypothetical protein